MSVKKAFGNAVTGVVSANKKLAELYREMIEQESDSKVKEGLVEMVNRLEADQKVFNDAIAEMFKLQKKNRTKKTKD